MLERLKDEKYLEKDGLTIQSIVDREMVDFENKMKRNLDVTKKLVTEVVWIQGLKANHDREKRFLTNRMKIEPSVDPYQRVMINKWIRTDWLLRDDIKAVFKPILERVAKLMEKQLNLAKERNLDVKVRSEISLR